MNRLELAEEMEEIIGNPFQVGDILSGTWGYSMSIPEFVQVVGVTPKSVKCRFLKKTGDNVFRGSNATAIKDDFDERRAGFTSRVKWWTWGNGKDPEPYIYHDHCILKLWDGKGQMYDYMD